MPVAPSFDDLLAQFEGEALAVRPTLQFLDGDIATAQEHGVGAMGDASIRYAAQLFKSTFLDGAEGDALTALVDDHLNIQRNPATEAQVSVTASRAAGGFGAGNLPIGFTVATAFDAAGNTVTFTLDTAIVFGAGDHGPHTAIATATVLGRVGNVAAGTVTRKVDAPFDANITITNVTDGAGGNDLESDPELRDRARKFWIALRGGTIAAIEFGALKVPSVRVAKATENQATGLTTLVVSDSDGNATAQMVSDVETEEENWRAAGSQLAIVGGTRLTVDLTGSFVFRDGSGADPTVYAPLCAAAIASRMAKLRQGEIGYLQALSAAGIAVDPDVIEAIVFTVPAIDITPSAFQTIRAGAITLT